MKRRTLLFSALTFVCSPAIVRASSLMAVKAVPVTTDLWFLNQMAMYQAERLCLQARKAW